MPARFNSYPAFISLLPCKHLATTFFFLYFKFGSTMSAVMWLRAQIFGIAVRWHFAGRQLPAVGFPRKIVLAPLICDLGIRDAVNSGIGLVHKSILHLELECGLGLFMSELIGIGIGIAIVDLELVLVVKIDHFQFGTRISHFGLVDHTQCTTLWSSNDLINRSDSWKQCERKVWLYWSQHNLGRPHK